MTQAILRQTGPKAKLIAALAMAALLAACATPVPKPAMVPLGQTGDFGYSDREVGQDRIEVTYTGSNIRVSSGQGKDDSRVKAEHAKIHDLALWRAAQIADQRGMAAMKIENETRDTDVQVTRSYSYGPAYPYYPYYPYHWRRYGYCCGPSWFYDDPFYYRPVNRANAQSITKLTVVLLKQYDPNDKTQLSVKETLAKLQTERAGAAY